MRIGTQILVVLVIGAGLVLGWVFRDNLPWVGSEPAVKAQQVANARPTVVEMVEVRAGPLREDLSAVGTVWAREAVTLTANVSGIVREISFSEGEWVDADTVIVRLDAAVLQAELAEARANAKNADRLYRRAVRLLKSRNVAQSRVDELLTEKTIADATVQAGLARLEDYVIRAPFSGRLGLRSVSVGTLIESGDPITTLDDTRTVKLDFEIPEPYVAFMRSGLELTATNAAYPGRVFAGQVRTVDSRLDPATRSMVVRAEIPNPDGDLKPGMFMTVSLGIGTKESALLIPEEAVLTTATGQYVFVVVDGRAKRQVITLGQRTAGKVEVVDGLTSGAVIVTGGVQKLRDGASVAPRQATEEARPSAG